MENRGGRYRHKPMDRGGRWLYTRGYGYQGRTGPPGRLAKARWAGAAVGQFDKNDNFKNL